MPGAENNQNPGAAGGETDEEKAAAKAIADAAAVEAAKKKNEGEDDLEKLTPAELAAEIKKLRKESGDRRVKNKALEEQKKTADDILGKLKQALGIEDEKQSPEEMAKSLKEQNSALGLE